MLVIKWTSNENRCFSNISFLKNLIVKENEMSHLLIDQVVYEDLRVYYYFILFNDKNGGLDKSLLYSFATRK